MVARDHVKNMIKLHEGYRGEVYADSVGVLTCGYGHALHEGSEIPLKVNELLFEIDFNKAVENAMKLVSTRSIQVDDVRFAVITDMMFNLGYRGLSKFKNMIAALQSEDYVTASREMLRSKWRTQVGKRAEKLAEMMETGRWV